MTRHERSAILGYYRSGALWSEIASIMGISVKYAKLIVENYLNNDFSYKPKVKIKKK